MTHRAFAVSGSPAPPLSVDYQPGVCNIGPAEIARRRRTGHIGLLAAVALFAILVAVGAPPLARLLVAIPAILSASGYLQAYLKFCAGFGAAGVYNFDEVGTTDKVADAASRAADRAKATRIGLASLAIGAVAGVVAVLLPV
jgi:hypothetical protein